MGIDIGGTKTLVASLDEHGVIIEHHKFPTPKMYTDFLKQLAIFVDKLTTKKFLAASVGTPSKVDREHGIAIAFGTLPWRNLPLRQDVKKIVHCPVLIENDANLAGLSEAMLIKNYRKVLYVTISTGIGTGFIVDQKIEPATADSEGGQMLLSHGGKLEDWEDFASGRAFARRFGKKASEIIDPKTWRIVAHDIALGLIELIAVMQPDAIVLGGGFGGHYDKYRHFLDDYLREYENPLFTVPVIKEAARPAFAVLYGCYDLASQVYGKTP